MQIRIPAEAISEQQAVPDAGVRLALPRAMECAAHPHQN